MTPATNKEPAVKDDLLERLRIAMKRAEPLPWAWEQCGDKCDAPVVGVVMDGNDQPLAGCITEQQHEADPNLLRFNIASDWGSGLEPSAPSANAAFVVEAVNATPHLIARIRALEEGLRDAERWLRDLAAGDTMVLADTLIEVADRYRALLTHHKEADNGQ